MDILNTTLSILACILYIIELYVEDALYPAYNDPEYGVSWQFDFFNKCEVVMTFFFLVDYILRFYLADKKVGKHAIQLYV